MNKVLVIGTVWPEPNSSAAGSRMLQILKLFIHNGYSITFASTANKSEHSFDLTSIGIKEQEIELNNSSFDEFLMRYEPNIVMFDRFMIEEQFGWRVAEKSPDAIRILDMEDLHCLRKTREECVKKTIEFDEKKLLSNSITKREIASIFRCDLNLVISKYEMDLLKDLFQVNTKNLFYLPFLTDNISQEKNLNFEERENFVSIGNFLHPPNWDSVLVLEQQVWPIIRKAIPQAQLHIYGSYLPEKAKHLHSEKDRFLIKGRAKNVNDVMRCARICLAPLRFGAGLKGKLLDAIKNGTPSITTSIGSEGMDLNSYWSGEICDDLNTFAEKAIELYQSQNKWETASHACSDILKQFDVQNFENDFVHRVNQIASNIEDHRTNNFVGSMLQHHTTTSSKYLSKWIEEKNKNV